LVDFAVPNNTNRPDITQVTIDGNMINVTYDTSLDNSSIPNNNQFTVLVNGIQNPVNVVNIS
jgi:Putative flagellar system-associated repeat